ncbi:hypothetical protein [Taklimakanibacter albus]|jgi:hypothetical protein|uniref:Uncharacterized protein n=1 Tax=Taklimakanibacter albus TaxID=2800327 RepID=A0ACC5QX17_9HYPH|nr:hypothetical protein [Aestuariivirga sp. YIM B02566]MBK1864902.1 hypothetical protein [Aestuariivirga sp. YIM B02566]
MRKELTRLLNRQMTLEAILKFVAPVLVGLPVALWLIFWATNVPVSREILDVRFVRWTVHQADKGQSLPRVFVDLPDGRTVAAVAWANWRPPEPGTSIRLQEEKMRWYGRNYRIVP